MVISGIWRSLYGKLRGAVTAPPGRSQGKARSPAIADLLGILALSIWETACLCLEDCMRAQWDT